jgi:hypothetical protein
LIVRSGDGVFIGLVEDRRRVERQGITLQEVRMRGELGRRR